VQDCNHLKGKIGRLSEAKNSGTESAPKCTYAELTANAGQEWMHSSSCRVKTLLP